MSPSIGLAAALAAASLNSLADGQTTAIPSGPCVRTAPADPKDADLFDAAKDSLDDSARIKLAAAGVKLDGKACRLLAADGHALTRPEVEALKAGKPAAAPKGGPDAAKKNAAAKLAVGNLAAAGGAAGTYADSTRRFDGAAGGVADAALPGGAPQGSTPELKAAAALAAGFETNFRTVDAGNALLKNFTDQQGNVRLPSVVMTDLGGGSVAAIYDRPSKTIQLDQKNAAQFVVDAAPEAERAALAKKLADPSRFTAYLLEHPEALKAVVDGSDTTVFHETFHAWQQRRDPRVDAVEGKDPVEWEREAYREELLYFHQRVMRDPTLEARSSDDELYRTLLRGYPEYKRYVTQLYQNGMGSSDFQTVEQILAKRAAAGRPGAKADLASLKTVASSYARSEDDFAANTVPAMQAQAFPKLIDRQMTAGHPEEALALAFDAPPEIREELGPSAFAATRRRIEGDPPAPVADRLRAWDVYVAYQQKTTNSNVLEPALFAIYQRDRRDAVEFKLAEAARARDKESREAAYSWARAYAAELPEKAALLKRIAAAESGKARVSERE